MVKGKAMLTIYHHCCKFLFPLENGGLDWPLIFQHFTPDLEFYINWCKYVITENTRFKPENANTFETKRFSQRVHYPHASIFVQNWFLLFLASSKRILTLIVKSITYRRWSQETHPRYHLRPPFSEVFFVPPTNFHKNHYLRVILSYFYYKICQLSQRFQLTTKIPFCWMKPRNVQGYPSLNTIF